MRFTVATAVAAMASGAVAALTHAPAPVSSAAPSSSVAVPAGGVVTETLTEYTTWCPEATAITHGGHTYSITTPGYITMTGTFTVTRPVVTQTVTQCHKCTSAAPVPTTPVVVPTSAAAVTSIPLVPSGAAATGAATPSSPAAFNAGSTNVAGAGVGLAAVFGAVALLL
ncbi:Uncharacterized protein PECH_005260 [Penicillium ucsense]|uniref:Clock-controlled protein 6 n=1 Tax=Penicillium ucsense TaxID=2839758 RepID=A0A8J8WCQ2_9EURO|nr:Uncharacterized protein PECM_006306 [Penicillium ucsense]KAF7736523.1 Uncharacterized protein PECH_005260 [Penicillium ucsense]